MTAPPSLELDTSRWSGDGDFTQTLIEALKGIDGIHLVRVEDAPASRTEAGYNFISNELFVMFETRTRVERVTRFGFLPGSRQITEKRMDMKDLEQTLEAIAGIGAPDYADEGMIQYLRSQRIVPPYQTRGYKLVELVRVYEADDAKGAA